MAALDVATVTADSPPDQRIAKAVQEADVLVAQPDPYRAALTYWDDVWGFTAEGTHLYAVAESVMREISYYGRWDPTVYLAWCERQANRTPDQLGLYPNG